MKHYHNSYQFVNNIWENNDISELSLVDIVNLSRVIIIIIKDSQDVLHQLDYNIILSHRNSATMTLNEYLDTNPPVIKTLAKDVVLEPINYNRIPNDKMTREGYDLLLTQDIPFVIHEDGITRTKRSVDKYVAPIVMYNADISSNYNFGYLMSKLPSKVIDLTPEDLVFNINVYIKKLFNINNSFLVMGNSFIPMTTLFDDEGTVFKMKSTYTSWLPELYVDNVSKIPPETIGLNSNKLLLSRLLSEDVITKLLTHKDVFIVELESEYPLGISYTNLANDVSYDYHEYPISNNWRLTNLVLTKQTGRYTATGIIGKYKNKNIYRTSGTDKILISNDVKVKSPLLSLELNYPVVVEHP